jgi:lipopolysaccharide/colanic/teichoic acid biosynthesis glycosyltransferase
MIKRLFDILISVFLLIVLCPIMIVIAILVILNLGLPILFKQVRPGYLGKPFLIFKFRTMSNLSSANGNLLSDNKRLTKLGRILRATSLDELPTLINVLIGDMSLVGPRPLLIEYLPLYDKNQARRHEVKPGITGWAQVHGRNALSWEEKFKLDVEYVEKVTLSLDLKILWMTFLNVVQRKGINADGHATMEEFTGTVRE